MTTDLTFNSANSDRPQTVTICIFADYVLEDSEFFNVTLTTADSNAILVPNSATVTIEDVDGKVTNVALNNKLILSHLPLPGITVGFNCPGLFYVAEDAGSVSITVEIQSGTPARDVIVTLQTVDGTARSKALNKRG